MPHLDDLDDEEFADEMKASLWRDQLWLRFLEPEVIDRTREALANLRASLEGQLIAHSSPDNLDWTKRAKRYMVQTSNRYGQVNRQIKNLNRIETAENAAFEQKWTEFSYRLATALENSDADDMLDQIILRGELTAREWLAARREQRLRKGKDI